MATCSFCALPETNSRPLVAGPDVFICAACARIALGSLGDHGARGLVVCSLCEESFAPSVCLEIEGRGFVCAGCARAIAQAVARS